MQGPHRRLGRPCHLEPHHLCLCMKLPHVQPAECGRPICGSRVDWSQQRLDCLLSGLHRTHLPTPGPWGLLCPLAHLPLVQPLTSRPPLSLWGLHTDLHLQLVCFQSVLQSRQNHLCRGLCVTPLCPPASQAGPACSSLDPSVAKSGPLALGPSALGPCLLM